MGKSTDRVKAALLTNGYDNTIAIMPASTRTAQEAADACNCSVDAIVKSLIFKGATSGQLYLLLVSGARQVDLARASRVIGEDLERADPKEVRDRTGFAIGGVAPIGHLQPIATFMDDHLLTLPKVWAAAGAPNAIFAIRAADLASITSAKFFTPC